MIRYQDERADAVDALRTRYLSGEITEAVFRASLHGVGGMTSEDISHTLRDYAPAAPGLTYEDARLEESRRWLERYRHGKA